MKITFDASSVTDLVSQLQEFIEGVEDLQSPQREQPQPEQPQPIAGNKLDNGDIPLPPKKKAGRPPLKQKEEVITPEVVIETSAPVVSGAAHAVTKEALTQLMQKLLEKSGPDQEKQKSAVIVIRGIFKEFGIAKLGELDEKRYHELKVKFEEELAR